MSSASSASILSFLHELTRKVIKQRETQATLCDLDGRRIEEHFNINLD
jgi:hypothetical protein